VGPDTALPWRTVLFVAAGLAVAGAVIAARYVRVGPLAAPAPPFRPRYVLTVFRERGPRLANLGYFGYMWELYAVWTWLPAYLAASTARTGIPLPVVLALTLVWGAAVIAGSGLFSACTSQVVDPRYTGTALTTQTAVGSCSPS
jgi:hypothetical protein